MMFWRFYNRNLSLTYSWIEFSDFLASKQTKTHTLSKTILVELVYFLLGYEKKEVCRSPNVIG